MPWDLGATEICVQGLAAARPKTRRAYLDIARAIKAAAPGIHLHAYRPQDVRDLADRGGLGLDGALAALRDAGVDTVPGHRGQGAERARARARRARRPRDRRWVEGITAAHRAGFRSTSVLFYGHVETARGAHRAPARACRAIQAATTARVHRVRADPAARPPGGVPLVAGRAPIDEHRAMVAVSRLMLTRQHPAHPDPVDARRPRAAVDLLQSGGDDLGGTLLDGRVLPEAGIEQGLELPLADAARIAARLFRPFRQRTTDYREPRRPGPR